MTLASCLRAGLAGLSLCLAGPVLAADNAKAVLDHYALVAHAKYEDALIAGKALETAVDSLIANPTEATLQAARDAWRAARIPYLQTEVYRFGNKVVDDWEPRVNSWPLDEGLIDYVADSYGTESDENEFFVANVVANPEIAIGGQSIDATGITPALLRDTLQNAGETESNVATGYHAIEFLLWGQDLNGTGPGAGNRPATDYSLTACTNGHCDRRAAYLKSATTLLIEDLAVMEKAWRPDGAAALEVTSDPAKGLSAMLTGFGSLSYGELAGERSNLGLLLHDPEEEQDCFSDNTANSHYHDVLGMVGTYQGHYRRLDGSELTGPSLSDLVRAKDPALDAEVLRMLDGSLAAAKALVDRAAKDEAYDQMLAEGNKEGNAAIRNLVDHLVAQTRGFERIITALDLANVTVEGSDSLDKQASVAQ